MAYIDNIVFACKLIENNGCNLWEDLMAIVIADAVLTPEVKTAIYSVLKKRARTTSASPIFFEREIVNLLDSIQSKGWPDLDFPDEILPALTVELRTYIFSKMIEYISTKLAEVQVRIADILTNNGMLPTVETT